MRAYVTVKLTLKEAVALSFAVSNSVDHPDCMEALFPDDGREMAAAYRGDRKLTRAIRAYRSRNY